MELLKSIKGPIKDKFDENCSYCKKKLDGVKSATHIK